MNAAGQRLRSLTAAGLLFVVLQEVALRAVFPLPEVLGFDRVRYSPLDLAPSVARSSSLANASFRVTSEPDGLEFVHRLNLYGFRDRDWSLRKPAGSTRVAFVGDSLVEGFMADGDDTIPAGFRDAAREAGARIDAMNLGVAAAGFPEYLRLVRDSVPLFRPDDLLLVLYPNDFRPAPFDPAWLGEPTEPVRTSPWAPRILHVAASWWAGRPVPRRWSARPFAFFSAVPAAANPWSDPERARAFRSFVDPEIADAMQRGSFNPFAVDALRVYEALLLSPEDRTPHLSALREFADRHALRLFVVYLPTRNQVSDRYRSSQRRFSRAPRAASFTGDSHQRQARLLRSTCAALGIPFLDLTPRLRALETGGRRLFHRYDEHMTGEGYRTVGSIVFRWWSEAGPSGAGSGGRG